MDEQKSEKLARVSLPSLEAEKGAKGGVLLWTTKENGLIAEAVLIREENIAGLIKALIAFYPEKVVLPGVPVDTSKFSIKVNNPPS